MLSDDVAFEKDIATWRREDGEAADVKNAKLRVSANAVRVCREFAGPIELVVARIRTDAQGRVAETSLLLESNASKQLRDCLIKTLGTSVLYDTGKVTKATLTLQFPQ